MHTNEWKDKYCKRFGLCEKTRCSCTCSAELKFIESLLATQRMELATEIKKWKGDAPISFQDGELDGERSFGYDIAIERVASFLSDKTGPTK